VRRGERTLLKESLRCRVRLIKLKTQGLCEYDPPRVAPDARAEDADARRHPTIDARRATPSPVRTEPWAALPPSSGFATLAPGARCAAAPRAGRRGGPPPSMEPGPEPSHGARWKSSVGPSGDGSKNQPKHQCHQGGDAWQSRAVQKFMHATAPRACRSNTMVEVYGAQKKIQLPFVMGGDGGSVRQPGRAGWRPWRDRKALGIDVTTSMID